MALLTPMTSRAANWDGLSLRAVRQAPTTVGACVGNPGPFDALIDRRNAQTVKAAMAICRDCSVIASCTFRPDIIRSWRIDE